MPRNKIPKLREPRGPCVQQVKEKFLEQVFKQAPDDFYQQDIRHVEQMDFLCQRFVIMASKNVDQAVKLLDKALRWRKEKKLHELVDDDFPQELTLSGALFLYEPDRFGNRTLYLRGALCRNCSELKSSLKDFLSYTIFKIDDCQDGTPFSVILDLTDASWANYDIELLMHLLSLLKDYFPVNLDYVLAVNFPWILSTVWAIVKNLIPSERRDVVMFIPSTKISEYVEPENCPPFLGGTCSTPISYVSKGSPTAVEYLLRQDPNISRKRLKEILHLFSDVITEEHQDLLRKQIDLHCPKK